MNFDDSTSEGDGQIMGKDLAMSGGQTFAIQRIPAKRPKPGLMRQHLTCLQAAAAVSGAKVDGAELGPQTLVFEPGQMCARNNAFIVGTAGSSTLVLQKMLPALMQCAERNRVSLSSRTQHPMSPPFHSP